mgnify:CR=1 FL=1
MFLTDTIARKAGIIYYIYTNEPVLQTTGVVETESMTDVQIPLDSRDAIKLARMVAHAYETNDSDLIQRSGEQLSAVLSSHSDLYDIIWSTISEIIGPEATDLIKPDYPPKKPSRSKIDDQAKITVPKQRIEIPNTINDFTILFNTLNEEWD